MRLLFIIVLFLFSAHLLHAQRNSKHLLSISAGRSFHGSGDLRGLVIVTEYTNRFKRRLSYSIGLATTIHDGETQLFYPAPASGRDINGSIRYVVGGVQAASHLGFHFVQSTHHSFLLKLGPVLRYQSSSLPDIIDISYPIATGLPAPVINLENLEPQRRFSVGGSVQLQYDYVLNGKLTLGIIGSFQTDTNEDNITYGGIRVGRKF